MIKPSERRVAIVGAGPIGLEAALYARQLGLAVDVYERSRVGEYVQQWGHVKLFSPFVMNCTPLGRAAITADDSAHEFPGENDYLTGREHWSAYIEPLAKCSKIRDCLHTNTQVVQVGRRGILKTDQPGDAKRAATPFRLLLRNEGKEWLTEADVVLDCSGTYGQHRWLGESGIPAPGELSAQSQIRYTLEDILGEKASVYAGKTVMVVGGGYSAATTASQLAQLAEQHSETWVIWLSRCTGTQPLKRHTNDPLRERDRLAARGNNLATRADANVEFHSQSVVRELAALGQDKGFRVSALVGKEERDWEVDRLIANVGYTPDQSIYRELQVHECYSSFGPMRLAAALEGSGGDCLQQSSQGPETLRNPEPNFYILGMKSYGRRSDFLLRVGFEQIREVFTLITGQPTLNLYKQSKAAKV